MTNRCPECGSDRVLMQASVAVRSDPAADTKFSTASDWDFSPQGEAFCEECEHTGTNREFERCECGAILGELCERSLGTIAVQFTWVPHQHRGTARTLGSSAGLTETISVHPECLEWIEDDEYVECV
jgi:hypothetical protein